MEEKVLIKSESYNVKKGLLISCIIGLVLSLGLYFIEFINWGLVGILISLIPFVASLLIGLTIFFSLKFNVVTVTDKNITVKVPFKVITIPTKDITAFGKGAFKSIYFGSSSGRIRIAFLKNNKEIYETIYNMLTEK